MHICVSKLTSKRTTYKLYITPCISVGKIKHLTWHDLIIGSGNGLSPGQRQTIILTNAGILLIRILGTNFSESLSPIHTFSLKKMHLNIIVWEMAILSRTLC